MRFPLVCLAAILILHFNAPAISRADEPALIELGEPQLIELQELWRVGDEEEFIFGVVAGIEIDEAGSVYILDRQLCEVQKFSPEGEYLATLGREGEGPGEFRNPRALILTPEGNLGVMMSMPGRVVVLSPDGDPFDDLPLPHSSEGNVLTLGGLAYRGGNLVIYRFERVFEEDFVDQNIYLQQVDEEGGAGVRYHGMQVHDIPNKMVLDETERGEVLQRWDVGPDGRVWYADGYTDYILRVWNPDGSVDRVIHRDYEPRRRSDEQITERTDLLRSLTRNWPPNTEIRVSDYDLSVRSFRVQPDGSCWVLTSRGFHDRPEGSLGVWDTWDASGVYTGPVALMAAGNPENDAVYLRGDLVFVVRGALSSRLAAAGGAMGAAGNEDEVPFLEVVCYSMVNRK